MGSNKTTVKATGAAGAAATIILLVASRFGVNFTGDQAVALGGAIITVAGVVAGYLHKPAA